MGKQKYWQRPWWMTLLDRTNFVVTALTALVIILTRSAGVVYFAAGALLCTITVKLLKNAIRQPRPVNQKSKQKISYGMPSTHSATITYYAIYITLACVYLPFHRSFPVSVWTRILPCALFLPYSVTVVFSRIWLGHHTRRQIFAGALYGSAFAVAWLKFWREGLDQYGPQLEDVVNRLLVVF